MLPTFVQKYQMDYFPDLVKTWSHASLE